MGIISTQIETLKVETEKSKQWSTVWLHTQMSMCIHIYNWENCDSRAMVNLNPVRYSSSESLENVFFSQILLKTKHNYANFYKPECTRSHLLY